MARRNQKNVGILGLGIIGSRVANHLRRKGFPVFVWNRTPKPFPNFVGSPIELAELCDVIQVFVSDDDALLEMVQRMKTSLTKQHVIIASCTVSPDTMKAAAEMVERRGGKLVDAPFTGSKGAADAGELVYYAGGEPEIIAQVRPVLQATSKQIIEIGAIGQASTMKVATNILTAAIVQGAAEAITLVVESGIAPEKFALAMQNNGSNSKTLEMKLPKMMGADFETQFSVKHMLKDMTIVSRLARALGFEFNVSDAARRALEAEVNAGRADSDYCAVICNFYPDARPLKHGGMTAEPPTEQQATFTGIEPSSEAAAPRHDEALRVEQVIAPTAETRGPAPAAAPPMTMPEIATAPVESAVAAATKPESANEQESNESGSLFRRFVRRSAS
jgi:3-hydroxyisobutyrate dehydrogenase-like beta-hydroxyacid dehydrogenase